jgi:biotin carboxyl carrier protein
MLDDEKSIRNELRKLVEDKKRLESDLQKLRSTSAKKKAQNKVTATEAQITEKLQKLVDNQKLLRNELGQLEEQQKATAQARKSKRETAAAQQEEQQKAAASAEVSVETGSDGVESPPPGKVYSAIRKLTDRRLYVERWVVLYLFHLDAIYNSIAQPIEELANTLMDRGIDVEATGEFGLQQYVIKNNLKDMVGSLVNEGGLDVLVNNVPLQFVFLPRCGMPVCHSEATCFSQADELMSQVWKVLYSVQNKLQSLLEEMPDVVFTLQRGLSDAVGMKAQLARAAPMLWMEHAQGVTKSRTLGFHRKGDSPTCEPGQRDCNMVRLSANTTIDVRT